MCMSLSTLLLFTRPLSAFAQHTTTKGLTSFVATTGATFLTCRMMLHEPATVKLTRQSHANFHGSSIKRGPTGAQSLRPSTDRGIA
jgi:hypothetical protein